ncbi:MAG TPA: hypothetical protein VGA22_12860 [Gemmatimonadales bacterium]|jgi:hypothetical protein
MKSHGCADSPGSAANTIDAATPQHGQREEQVEGDVRRPHQRQTT